MLEILKSFIKYSLTKTNVEEDKQGVLMQH